MANSYVDYTGNGSTTAYSIPFPFITSSHVTATVNAVSTAITISGSTATFGSAPASAAKIRISRNSSQTTRLVDYTQPSTLTEEDLDQDSLQAFYIAQEATDTANEALGINTADLQWTAESKRITNVANPTADQDAATKHYLENTWLSTSDKANITTVAGKATEIGRLGTSDAVADMAILGTSDVVTDMNTLGTSDVVSDMNTLGTSDVVTDMNTLATSSNVTNMNTLAGISSDITAVSGISANVTAVATNAVKYTWSNSTTMGDPGSGAIRFNNATVGSVSLIAIDDSDSGGDISTFINSWDDSTNTNKGTLTIRKGGAAGTFAIFTVTALTDNSGWSQLAVTHVVSNGTWSNADIAFVEFARSGDKGADGDDASEVFKTISVSGQDDIVADGATDTLTLVAGEGVDITTTAGTDSITFAGEDSSVTNKGLVELATTAETTSGSDTDRAITPAGLHGGIAGLSDATVTASDKFAFVDVGSSDALKTDTVQGILDLAGSGLAAASVAEMEAASSNTVAVTPGRITRSPLVLKVAGAFENDGSLMTSTIGVSSVTDNGTGTFQINFSTNFGSHYFTPVASAHGTAARSIVFDARAVGDVDVYVFDSGGSAADPGNCYFHIQGDQ